MNPDNRLASVPSGAPLAEMHRRVPRAIRRRAMAVIVGVLVLGIGAWYERAPLLREVAALWIVSDPVAPADVVVVLGGGVEDRPFAAAEYYRAGVVRKIVVSNAHQGPAEKLGAALSSASADEAVLLKLGVPASAIEIFGDDLKNTDEEALALRDWVARNGMHRVIVPSEIFSARRVRWIMRHVLGEDATVAVPALDPPDYDRNNWWHSEKALVDFQNEMVKYVYYRIRY